MSEIWKPVVGYEGKYEVSNLGRVRSLSRVIDMPSKLGNIYPLHHNGKVLKMRLNNKGYYYLRLCGKMFTVHRLVAKAFVSNPNGYSCVNHKDENPKNNKAENLEWCTFQYNLNYGTCRARIGKKCWVAVVATDGDGKEYYFSSMREAQEKTGVDYRNITNCCRNVKHRQTAGGYKWRYARKDE